LIFGVLPSVRLPSRMVLSWVTEPMGLAMPRLMASTPAMKVVVTAPMPGMRIPSFPSAGWMTGVGLGAVSGVALSWCRGSCIEDKRLNSFSRSAPGSDAQFYEKSGVNAIRYNSSFMRPRATTGTTNIISAIIADDEQLARDELNFLLGEIGDVEVVAQVANGIDALEVIGKLEPAVAFLDIQMPGLDGLGVVRTLRERDIEPPHVIFSTAYDQFALEAFRLEAMDYILKPVERERLEETVGRARRLLADKTAERINEATALPSASRLTPAFNKLLLKSGARNLIVDPQELIYATIEDGVITLVTGQAEGQANFRTLEELQASLDPGIFWRAHRSFVVNINKIREVMPWFKSSFQLKMDDKKSTEIPVSRVQSKRLREMLKL